MDSSFHGIMNGDRDGSPQGLASVDIAMNDSARLFDRKSGGSP
jgi:hypothetical protein